MGNQSTETLDSEEKVPSPELDSLVNYLIVAYGRGEEAAERMGLKLDASAFARICQELISVSKKDEDDEDDEDEESNDSGKVEYYVAPEGFLGDGNFLGFETTVYGDILVTFEFENGNEPFRTLFYLVLPDGSLKVIEDDDYNNNYGPIRTLRRDFRD